MTNHRTSNERGQRLSFAGLVRRFFVLIILAWLALIAVLSWSVPSLEQVAKERAVSVSAKDAPSVKAMMRIGQIFEESNTDSMAMIIIESDRPLDDDAHHYYDRLLHQLS